MAEFLAANPWLIGVVVVLALVLVWWLFVANRKTRVITTKPDVLDEGAAPAKRNQALIDSPSAAATPGSVLASASAPQPAPVPAAAPAPAPVPAPAPAPKPAAKAAPKPRAAVKPKAEPKAKAEAKPAAKAKPAAPKPAAPKPAPAAKAAAKPKAEATAKPAAAPKAKAEPKPAAKAEPKAAAKPKPAPKPKAAPAPKPAPKTVVPDALIQIKGLGPKMEVLFKDLGVTSFAQIAAWTPADIARIDAQIGTFAGRIARDNFVEQAKLLAAGDIAGFEAKFGAL